MNELSEMKPVAEIAEDWSLRYVGSGPLAGLVRTHGIEREQKLFQVPDTHRVVSVELLRDVLSYCSTTQLSQELRAIELRAIIDNKGATE